MSDVAKRFFIDTSVLLYSVDAANRRKHEQAREWLDALWTTDSGRLSWQVLNEFYANAVGKLKSPVPRACETVETFVLWQPVGFGLGMLRRAWELVDIASLPYWDALIVAAAEVSGSRYILSEDFQAGQKFGAVTIVNPFVTAPSELDLP